MGSARGIQPFPALSVAAFLVAVLLGGNAAWAQTPPAPAGSPSPGVDAGGVTVTPRPPTPPPPTEFGFEPSLPPGEGAPREDAHGERVRTIYQPAFVKGAVQTNRTSRTSGIRVGLSGWTAPRIPYDDKDSSGFPALGITIEWGTPMEPPAEPSKPGQR
jgi:hypothetical protein